jgi:hypothetical protein
MMPDLYRSVNNDRIKQSIGEQKMMKLPMAKWLAVGKLNLAKFAAIL